MSAKLNEMIENVDASNENVDNSIEQINNQITETQEQIDAVTNDILTASINDMTSYLENTKITEVGGKTVKYLTDFGDKNISDFQILDASNVIVYEYLGTGWDNDQTIIDLIDDFDFGYDYIHKEFDENGTYGLQAKLDQLNIGKSLLESNKQKYTNSKEVFSKYV